VLGRLCFGERGGLRPWLGSAGALAGVAVLAGPGAITGASGYLALAGFGLVLASTLSFAAYTIVLRPLSAELGAVRATAASTVVGTLPYLAFAWMLPGAGLPHLGAVVWANLVFLGVGSAAAGMLLWNVAILADSVSRVSLLLYLEPVVSVVAAGVFLGEHITLAKAGGGLLILAGVAIASTNRPSAPSSHDLAAKNVPLDASREHECTFRPPRAGLNVHSCFKPADAAWAAGRGELPGGASATPRHTGQSMPTAPTGAHNE
jgi:drug/metabolite transporter (DMT)-like permease